MTTPLPIEPSAELDRAVALALGWTESPTAPGWFSSHRGDERPYYCRYVGDDTTEVDDQEDLFQPTLRIQNAEELLEVCQKRGWQVTMQWDKRDFVWRTWINGGLPIEHTRRLPLAISLAFLAAAERAKAAP